jgi:hypothetical protein
MVGDLLWYHLYLLRFAKEEETVNAIKFISEKKIDKKAAFCAYKRQIAFDLFVFQI